MYVHQCDSSTWFCIRCLFDVTPLSLGIAFRQALVQREKQDPPLVRECLECLARGQRQEVCMQYRQVSPQVLQRTPTLTSMMWWVRVLTGTNKTDILIGRSLAVQAHEQSCLAPVHCEIEPASELSFFVSPRPTRSALLNRCSMHAHKCTPEVAKQVLSGLPRNRHHWEERRFRHPPPNPPPSTHPRISR